MKTMLACMLSLFFLSMIYSPLSRAGCFGCCNKTTTVKRISLSPEDEEERAQLLNELQQLTQEKGKNYVEVANIHGRISNLYRKDSRNENRAIEHKKLQLKALRSTCQRFGYTTAKVSVALGKMYVENQRIAQAIDCFCIAEPLLEKNWKRLSQAQIVVEDEASIDEVTVLYSTCLHYLICCGTQLNDGTHEKLSHATASCYYEKVCMLFQNTIPRIETAKLYMSIGKAFGDAGFLNREQQEKLTLKQKRLECYMQACSILDRLNWQSLATKDLLKIIRMYLQYALAAYRLREYDGAIAVVEKVLYLCEQHQTCNPEQILAMFLQGLCHCNSEDASIKDEGINCLEAAEAALAQNKTELRASGNFAVTYIKRCRKYARRVLKSNRQRTRQ